MSNVVGTYLSEHSGRAPTEESTVEFWASSEVYQPAYGMLSRVRREVEARLNVELNRSNLSARAIKFRYVPVVMPDDMKDRYPARSRPLPAQGIYDCAPQLDYDTFVNGAYDRCVDEYLRGVLSCASSLTAVGMTDIEIELFEALVGRVRDAITLANAATETPT